MLEIQSNGSKWAGQSPDSIDMLLDVLAHYPLDPTFERYGNFVREDKTEDYLPSHAHCAVLGSTVFFGNFYNLSHVFRIRTDERYIVDALTAAIRKNQQSPEYLAAREATGYWHKRSVSDDFPAGPPHLVEQKRGQLDLFGGAA